MGEVSDMMLDGTLCQSCGGYIGEAVGYPLYCDDCGEAESIKFDKASITEKVQCPECGKKVHESGLNQHIVAKHSEKNNENG